MKILCLAKEKEKERVKNRLFFRFKKALDLSFRIGSFSEPFLFIFLDSENTIVGKKQVYEKRV